MTCDLCVSAVQLHNVSIVFHPVVSPHHVKRTKKRNQGCSTWRWFLIKNLTSCVIQVELYLFSSKRDSGDIFFEHWWRIFLFLAHKRKMSILWYSYCIFITYNILLVIPIMSGAQVFILLNFDWEKGFRSV